MLLTTAEQLEEFKAEGSLLIRSLIPDAVLAGWRRQFAAAAAAHEPPVDLAEADQLNALHDRLLGLCCRHGVPRVQLEAVSFVQRAVKAHMRRLLVASAEFAPAAGEGGATRRTVGTRELNAALTQPTSSAWLPPNGGKCTVCSWPIRAAGHNHWPPSKRSRPCCAFTA